MSMKNMSKLIPKKDNSYCCVPQCTSKGSKDPFLSFHKFPNVNSKIRKKTASGVNVFVSRRDEWIRILRIGKPVSLRMCVCSKHFTPKDYNLPAGMSYRPRLSPLAVPSCFLPVSPTNDEIQERLKQNRAVKKRLYEGTKAKTKRKKVKANVIDSSSEITSSSVINSYSAQNYQSDDSHDASHISDFNENNYSDLNEDNCIISDSSVHSALIGAKENSKGENDKDVGKKLYSSKTFVECKIGKREKVFGHFIASEMSALCENPAVYLKTKKIILKALIDAHSEIISSCI